LRSLTLHTRTSANAEAHHAVTKRNANANVATVLHRDRKATPYVLRMLSSNLLDATSGGADSVDYAVRRKKPFFVWVYLYAKRGSFSKTGSGRTNRGLG
jgi:hypothetical protein